MKRIVSIMGAACMLTAAAWAQAPAKKASVPAGVPANAEKVSEGMWKAKDAKGKVWIYTKSPFGISRYEDDGSKPGEGSKASREGLKIVEVKGDEVVFEQPTPFGKSRWTRTLAEMNADEKAVYAERQKNGKVQK